MNKQIAISVIIVLLLLACGLPFPAAYPANPVSTVSIETAIAGTQTAVKEQQAPTYEIIYSTGLYSTFGDADAKQLAVLDVGTLLVPADNNETLFCDTFIEADITFTLCKVTVVETGQTGWILEKWIEKN